MKNLITIFPTILLLAGCNQAYPSKTEAREACKKWLGEDKAVTVLFTDYNHYERKQQTRDFKIRRCELEEETQQYLGFYYPSIADGSYKKENDNKWKGSWAAPAPGRKVVKRFRF